MLLPARDQHTPDGRKKTSKPWNNPLKNPNLYFPRYIPVEVIHPIVKEYCDSRDMGTVITDVHYKEAGAVLQQGGKKNTGARYSATEALAFEAGIRPRTVHDIYLGKMTIKRQKKPARVEWKTVDKLLTAMNLVHLWYEEPLSEYYTPRLIPCMRQEAA
jgi:hypothetical protein